MDGKLCVSSVGLIYILEKRLKAEGWDVLGFWDLGSGLSDCGVEIPASSGQDNRAE
jgi:hypothetical protein